MKRAFTISLLAVWFVTGAVAQITSSEMPAIGDTVVYRQINKNTFDPGPANTGVGVVWDFPSVVLKTDTVQVEYIDPSTTTEGTQYPGATVAEATAGTTGHFFYRLTSNGFFRTGFYTDELTMVYNDSLKLCTLPFQFGSTFNDSYTGTGTFPVLGTPFPAMIDDGDYSFDVDGSGTLRLPCGTFNNVFRVYYEESFTIKADIGLGSYSNIAGIDEYGYEWWKAGHVKPLLTYYYTTTTDYIQGGSQVDEVVRFDKYAVPDGPNPGISETDAPVQMIIAPNPASSMVNLLFSGKEIRSIRIFGVSGIIYYQAELNGQTQIKLDVSSWAPGIYFVELGDGDRNYFSRLTVQ